MEAKSSNSVRTVGRKRTVSLNLKADTFAAAIGGGGGSSSSSRRNSAANVPLLMLTPLNETFEHKIISLPIFPETLRIGRQTNTKTVPALDNGYFDSKVLSRQHAELWGDRSGRAWIRDVKSSNGTFVNGARLSFENRESDPKELVTQDVLELGIDIVGEDSKTVLHQKVAARVEYAGFPMASIGSGMGGGSNGHTVSLADLDPLTSTPASHPLHPAITPTSLATYEMISKKLSRDIRLAKTTSFSLRHSADLITSTESDEGHVELAKGLLTGVEVSLESTRAELRSKEDKVEELTVQLSIQQRHTQELEHELGARNDTLLLQLHAAQEELRALHARAGQAEAEAAQKQEARAARLRQPLHFVSAFGVVLLGVGLMSTLNGWSRTS